MSKKKVDMITFRLRICLFIFILMIIYIVFKLGQIMIIKNDEYTQRAKRQQYRENIIVPIRGTIYDSTGKELAVSIPQYDLWMEIKHIRSSKKSEELKKEIVDKITSTVEVSDKEKLKKTLNSKSNNVILLQALSLDDRKKIEELKLPYTWFDEKTKRHYPYGNFASYVLGHTSDNNVGLAGIEASMDLELKGIPGKRLYVQDANGKEISLKDMKYSEEIDGKNVVLTVNEVLQHNMEKVLHNAYAEFTPKSVTAILMETKTGNILAMSTIPDYNPNLPREPAYEYYAELMKNAENDEAKMKVVYNMWRNPAVNNLFEPGSPFKLITAAAAIEENKTYTDDYFVDNGFIDVAGTKLRNWTPRPFGGITFKRAIEQSVNTVFVQVGQRLGAETLINYTEAFGFGKTTNINLPGEEPGVVRNLSQIGPVELASMSYGQGISVTPLQLITAINAIGNEGKLVEPNIVSSITDKKNNIISRTTPKTLKQVISPQTASTIMSYMESVVSNGSGKKAKIEGFRIAGKTGSANKIVEGQPGYSPNKFICTFAAIVPVEDPKITLLVVIDEPREGTQSGSESAAPIAGRILEGTLKYMGINQNVKIDKENSQKTIAVPELKNKSYTDAVNELKELKLVPAFEPDIVVELESHVVSTFPEAGEMVEPNSSIMLYMRSNSTQEVSMPNLVGLTKEQAQALLDNLELKYNFSGAGKVSEQAPKAGTLVNKDFRVNIQLK